MNMLLWLLDFVTPLNKFFRSFSILVYNNTIISLRLIVYYLIIANSGLRPSLAIRQYTIRLGEIIIKYPDCKVCSTRTHCFSENVYFTKKSRFLSLALSKKSSR